MADMMNKWVLFLAVDGFEAGDFATLWQCFGDLNASTRIASFNADDELRSKDGLVDTHSDMSFAEGSEQPADVVVIADGITANAIKDDLAAKTVLMNAAERNAAIVSIGEGMLALIEADIISGKTVAAPQELKEQVESAGASMSDQSIAASQNIFSATSDANIKVLCNAVADYITKLAEAA